MTAPATLALGRERQAVRLDADPAAPGYPSTPEVEACYVCGWGPHAPTEMHTYWPMSEAEREFAAQPATSYDQAAAYVAEHRPY